MRFLKEERAQSEWSSVYMLIVMVIAALVLIAVIKPMFRQSQQIVKKTAPRPS
jgi:competence protein ComGC